MNELEDLSDSSVTTEAPRPHNLISILIISLFCFLFSIGCCYFALFSVSFRSGLSAAAAKHAKIQTECLKSLPVKYSVDPKCLFPNRHHNKSFSKWASAIIYAAEASYRSHGILKWSMPVNEYVKMSESKYAYAVAEMFGIPVANIKDKMGLVFGKRTVGHPENVHQLAHGAPSTISCFWTDSDGKLPVIYKNTQKYFGIKTIKDMLSTNGRPLVVAFRVPNQRISVGNKSYSFPPHSSIMVHSTKNGIHENGEHITMAIVGYNDNFLVKGNNTTYHGGFIMRSGYGYNEHSLEYFMSQLVDDQEEILCPDIGNPKKWTNLTLDCVNQDFCSTSKTYTQVDNSTYISSDGDIVTLPEIPSHYMNHVFLPHKVTRNFERCGYSFVPYDVVHEIEERAKDAFGFVAYDIQLDFESSAYAKNCENCHYIHSSTYKFQIPKSVFPYENPTEL